MDRSIAVNEEKSPVDLLKKYNDDLSVIEKVMDINEKELSKFKDPDTERPGLVSFQNKCKLLRYRYVSAIEELSKTTDQN